MQYYYYILVVMEMMIDCMLVFFFEGLEVMVIYVDGSIRVVDNVKFYFFVIFVKVGMQIVIIIVDEVIVIVEVKVVEFVVVVVSNLVGIIGVEDNLMGWWIVFFDNFNVLVGEIRFISFINYIS